MVKLCRVEDLRADPKVLQVIPRLPRPKGNPGRKNPPVYRSAVSAFDIETTSFKDKPTKEDRALAKDAGLQLKWNGRYTTIIKK